ncbi:hypothetical protein JFPO13_contig000047-0002 [Edwardsiella piscicida]|nr:hypothetical protein JFPO13_contig000047-0002 [Edwardsiella piscicida]
MFTRRNYTAQVTSYGPQQEFMTAYSPQQNGMAERERLGHDIHTVI